MKKLLYILLISAFISCESVTDCFQSEGSLVQEEVTGLASFTRILVNRDVELILTDGPVEQVTIETGDNLIDGVTAVVSNGELILTDDNTCNYTRDYNVTKVYVTAPNITEIRSSTQFPVRSQGTLTYPELRLISEDDTNSDFNNVGDFYLDLNLDRLTVTNNNHSNYFISGTANYARIVFVSGGGRFEGANFLSQEVSILHRGYNDMIVNPIADINGEIRSTGDVRAQNQPPAVAVEEFYTGRLIFE
ncbi:MAG: DUF2807 domain-containing protein [Flavobacteriaceae bacterium]|nr:DUF2807 domain-containing protein [Flavobacteriaceae bacterium]